MSWSGVVPTTEHFTLHITSLHYSTHISCWMRCWTFATRKIYHLRHFTSNSTTLSVYLSLQTLHIFTFIQYNNYDTTGKHYNSLFIPVAICTIQYLTHFKIIGHMDGKMFNFYYDF